VSHPAATATMRSPLPITLLTLVPVLVASSATSECLKSKAKELSFRSLCGDKTYVRKCLEKPAEGTPETIIENCLANAGCTQNSATSEANYLVTFCEGEPGELRRKHNEGKSIYQATISFA
jgi:hypothetical protein